ncbi:unnamed protein product [Phyllotreta striolata]|uniref:C2H2-type domain-containing protein n=1 Tax=Phyllotreta striolata TaxID=444603 RepID=A0A9N9XTK1_PHYSR|nr:unnamed protein product [Phyllotreta striolata]
MRNVNGEFFPGNLEYYVNGDYLYCCPVCHKKYRGKGAVIRHRRYECNKDPTFECRVCQKKFKQRSNLYTHVTVVHKETVEKLRRGWSRSAKSGRLTRAFFAAYQCERCPKRYTKPSSLNFHRKYECGKEKTFKCYRCLYSTYRAADLRRHFVGKHRIVGDESR